MMASLISQYTKCWKFVWGKSKVARAYGQRDLTRDSTKCDSRKILHKLLSGYVGLLILLPRPSKCFPVSMPRPGSKLAFKLNLESVFFRKEKKSGRDWGIGSRSSALYAVLLPTELSWPTPRCTKRRSLFFSMNIFLS